LGSETIKVINEEVVRSFFHGWSKQVVFHWPANSPKNENTS